ncbi:MAG: aspartate/glutamate racemase family protein [Burkholderiales bacterium]
MTIIRAPKLGLIVPSLNSVMEFEMQRMAGGTASIHTMRVSAHTTGTREAVGTRENLLWMDNEAPQAAKLLAHAKVDVICFGCTAGGVVKGAGADRAIIDAIEAAAGVPATVTSTASCDALRALGVTRVSVASPYEPWLNDYLRGFLEKSGFEVCAIDGFGAGSGGAVGPHNAAAVTPEQVAALARAVDRPAAQAIFISCTNFRTLEIIEPLERELGKPVLTATSASMWKMLRLARDERDMPGAGKLFKIP